MLDVRQTVLSEGVEQSQPMEEVVEEIESFIPNPESRQIPNYRHSAYAKHPPVGATPRTVIVRLTIISFCSEILAVDRTTKDIQFVGDHLHFYQNQMHRVQALRLSFWEAKRALRLKNVQYSTVQQATLRVIHHDKTVFFV